MSVRRRLKRQMERRVARDGVKETLAYLDRINTETTAELREEAKLARAEDTKFVLSMTMAVSVMVLCRDMKWKPVEGTSNDYKKRLPNYVAFLNDELNRVFDDPDFTLQKYADDVELRYGVKCRYGEE